MKLDKERKGGQKKIIILHFFLCLVRPQRGGERSKSDRLCFLHCLQHRSPGERRGNNTNTQKCLPCLVSDPRSRAVHPASRRSRLAEDLTPCIPFINRHWSWLSFRIKLLSTLWQDGDPRLVKVSRLGPPIPPREGEQRGSELSKEGALLYPSLCLFPSLKTC